jgi:hypothetical protein
MEDKIQTGVENSRRRAVGSVAKALVWADPGRQKCGEFDRE